MTTGCKVRHLQNLSSDGILAPFPPSDSDQSHPCLPSSERHSPVGSRFQHLPWLATTARMREQDTSMGGLGLRTDRMVLSLSRVI
jgi:ABC-type Fe3+ transport system substrate-binding protein